MNKQYESNGFKSENPFEIALVNKNGEMEEYYLLNNDAKEKITLSDLVNEQVDYLNEKCEEDASSGDYARNASSGDNARNASSGDNAQNAVTGKNSVVFDCGFNSITKAAKGTWISLCEYKKNDEGRRVPFFALSAQIGNHDYVDFKGNTLSENEFYILQDKEFTPVILHDGLKLIKNSSKIKGGIEIIKCKELDCEDELYCVRKGALSAHGRTLKQAMSDLRFKEMENKDASEIVEKIKECGYVTREDYRCITGACSFGTEQFAKEHGYENVDKVELSELLSRLDDKYYGAREFKDLFN